MRVLVASSLTPFAQSSRHALVKRIAEMLRSRQIQIDEVWLPVDERFGRWPEDALSIRLTDVSHAADLLITVGPAAALLEHPQMVMWWDASDAHWLEEVRGPAIALQGALRGAHRVVSSSMQLTERLLDQLGVSAVTIDPHEREPEAIFLPPA